MEPQFVPDDESIFDHLQAPLTSHPPSPASSASSASSASIQTPSPSTASSLSSIADQASTSPSSALPNSIPDPAAPDTVFYSDSDFVKPDLADLTQSSTAWQVRVDWRRKKRKEGKKELIRGCSSFFPFIPSFVHPFTPLSHTCFSSIPITI
eukprot:TRINITY_DN462_c0_g2_i1.p1 TRINITY_DN462_c0_g2~~TRINITY_DN462_c0_g2_i1.p1  ORF type:complete len:152 (+),score=14.76 TRINITY_DN462_c0_g2_i1:1140-1595(+)